MLKGVKGVNVQRCKKTEGILYENRGDVAK